MRDLVTEIFAECCDGQLEIDVISVSRIGYKLNAPVRVELRNHYMVTNILSGANYLKRKRSNPTFMGCYLSADLSYEERKKRKELVRPLKEKIESDPSVRWVISNGSVIKKGVFVREHDLSYGGVPPHGINFDKTTDKDMF